MSIGEECCFNPRAPCGARRRDDNTTRELESFNPRAPCGARPRWDSCPHRLRGFNPRAPCGARRVPRVLDKVREGFQSTRPMRGATPINPFPKSLYNVSIHAPHAGRDASSPTPCGSFSGFNPRAPCGARLSYAEKISPAYGWFQSTRPMRGATSPHTSSKSCIGCFNPRAPCGARRIKQ